MSGPDRMKQTDASCNLDHLLCDVNVKVCMHRQFAASGLWW